MNANRFDFFTRSIDIASSRRTTLGALFGGGIAALLSRLEHDAAAKKKRKTRKRRKRGKKKVTFNEFGCVNVGSFCNESEECCSGICQGKQGKRKCQAHHTGGCTGHLHGCAGDLVPCVTATDENGICARTTGNAGYCHISAVCFPCTKDTDCEAACGPQAACIVCEGECEPNGTGCAGPSGVSC